MLRAPKVIVNFLGPPWSFFFLHCRQSTNKLANNDGMMDGLKDIETVRSKENLQFSS